MICTHTFELGKRIKRSFIDSNSQLCCSGPAVQLGNRMQSQSPQSVEGDPNRWVQFGANYLTHSHPYRSLYYYSHNKNCGPDISFVTKPLLNLRQHSCLPLVGVLWMCPSDNWRYDLSKGTRSDRCLLASSDQRRVWERTSGTYFSILV